VGRREVLSFAQQSSANVEASLFQPVQPVNMAFGAYLERVVIQFSDSLSLATTFERQPGNVRWILNVEHQ
jgi:hypothetical protein